MKQTTTVFIAVLLLWCCGLSVYAQSATTITSGKEFYITFLCNAVIVPHPQLKVVVEKPCRITAKYNNRTNTYLNGWNNTLVQPGVYTVEVTYTDDVFIHPNENIAGERGITTNRTITLTSTEDVCVYANRGSDQMTTDATVILPVSVWGTEYRLATAEPYMWHCFYAVTASQDSTVVTLHNNNTIILHKNEVYHHQSVWEVSMTGMKVSATKPIGVFSGSDKAYGPGQSSIYNGDVYGCGANFFGGASINHTYEQLWSVDKWGTEFLAFPLRTPGSLGNWGGMLAIIADQNGTNVTLSGGINRTYPNLLAGQVQYVCDTISGLTEIVSNQPVMVFLVLPSATVTNIQPITQQIRHTLVEPFVPIRSSAGATHHGIDLLVPAAWWNETVIKENGSVANLTYTIIESSPNWYHIRKNFFTGNTSLEIDITCPGGFQAYVSGTAGNEISLRWSYAYSAGAFPPRKDFTIQEKETIIDTYYENTAELTHTFKLTDTIIVKRTVNIIPFDSISWLINNIPYPIPENTNNANTLDFLASALSLGENTISMLIHSGTTIDTLTGSVWREYQKEFTIQEQGTTIDTHYENTAKITHSFESTDTIIVKRIVDIPFDSISWLINNISYPIPENTNNANTLNFPASALSLGENTISMLIHSGTTIDTLTGSVWQRFLIRGTMFPFVHTDWGDPEYDNAFNALFPVTASLYELPPPGEDDPMEYLQNNSTPVQTVQAVYYDGSTYVPGTPKYPGTPGKTNQPDSINWSRIGKAQDTATIYTPVTGIGDVPITIQPDAVGMFTFENVIIGEDYILYLHRPGYLARYAKVTITPTGTLGHRFLIPGDLNGNGRIDSHDISLLNSNYAVYGRPFDPLNPKPMYNPAFDLDANTRVESHDNSRLNFYLNSTQNIYWDTFNWIREYYLQP